MRSLVAWCGVWAMVGDGLRRRHGRTFWLRRPREPIAYTDVKARTFPPAKLDHVARAATDGASPRPKAIDNPDHHLIGVDEDDVDREPHEVGVDCPRRSQDDPVTGLEFASAQLPAQPTPQRVCQDAMP